MNWGLIGLIIVIVFLLILPLWARLVGDFAIWIHDKFNNKSKTWKEKCEVCGKYHKYTYTPTEQQ